MKKTFFNSSCFFLFSLLFITLFFPSCKNFKELTISKVENLKIIEFSARGMEVGLGIKIKNPNSLNFSIYNSSFDVKLNDVFIGTASMKEKVKIKAHSEELKTFVFVSDMSKINFMALPKILAIIQEKNVNVLVEGKINVGNFFYKRNIPVNLNQKIELGK